MAKVNPPNNELSTYYLPHHAVIKPDSTTTKLRVVFNASSPSSNGTSLNDILYPGPVLQADLTILLLRWRFFRYVYNADIEKLYRQILVHPAHTPYSNTSTYITEEEAKVIHPHITQIKNFDILQNFSDLTKALRVVAQMFRFYNRIKRKSPPHEIHETEISTSELTLAKNRLIIACQHHHFNFEYQQLSEGQPIPRKSHLLPFNPFIDSDGIIRVNGRLSNSPTLNYHKRTKWKYPQRNLEINDLVVIKQENLPPNQWRIGRILKVYPGPDQRIRVVDVRTSNGVITRPITKLVLLPIFSIQRLCTYSSFYLIIANSMQHFPSKKSSPPRDKRSPSHAKSSSKSNGYDCRICDQDHPLRKCAKFNRMNVRERQKVVQRFKYCTNCLAHSHRLSKCRTNSCCRQCGAKHHTLLHCHERLRPCNEQMILTVSCGTVTPTVVVKIKATNKWHQIRGLLNPCAEFSSIAQFLVNGLRLPQDRIGNDDWCTVFFRSRFDEGSTFSVTAKINKNLPAVLGRKRLDAKLADRFTNLRLADPEFYLSGGLTIILGADIYPQLIRNEIQPQFFGSAMAQDTMLGWTIIGKIGF